ncbi:Wnt6-like protein [Leptotrombidium deliense]|uniref:Protein Wnt n=1 Tax=Leptotrombidium deliense TaxID=299467 RepID=A0A443SHH3_9ACAR|nr:Wnt6-like protein [Leptotrombidium deliense]
MITVFYRGLANSGEISNSILDHRESNSIVGGTIFNGLNVPLRKKQRRLVRDNPGILNAISKDTRETSFVNAITAAGVTYAVSQACSLGALLDCSCQRISVASYDWRGCSDNIEFGYRKSKEFMDDRFRKRSDVKTFVLSHNYEAGRLTVRNYMRTVCKCHGMSGSCTLKTCWRKLPLFKDVGQKLKEKFDGAAKVMAGNNGRGFVPESDTLKIPGKEDLVYSEESPAFCEPNRKTGSLGTQGRECNHTSMGVDGCELLCCGRGSVPIRKKERNRTNFNSNAQQYKILVNDSRIKNLNIRQNPIYHLKVSKKHLSEEETLVERKINRSLNKMILCDDILYAKRFKNTCLKCEKLYMYTKCTPRRGRGEE